MTDVPFRVYGPQPLNAGLGETMYTAPAGTQKFFIRDVTFSNIGTSAIRVKSSIGSITDLSKRIIDQDIAANSTTSIRPLWLLDANEILQGLQVSIVPVSTVTTGILSSGTDGTAYVTAAWTPAANTMYVLVQANGVASGTTALNPSSITGNGSWTLINQTTSTVAAARNTGVSAWWWYSSAAGSNATTTVNFSSTQHSAVIAILSVTNIYPGTAAVPPWTGSATPITQSAVAADTTAPASTTASKTVTLPSAIQTGLTFYYAVKTANTTTTPPSSMTENDDRNINDVAGSVCSLVCEFSTVTTPPFVGTTLGPATFATNDTESRASIGFEMVPSGWVNCMVSGIEVR